MSAPVAPTEGTSFVQLTPLSDDELLKLRLCDLPLRIEDSDLAPRIAQLFDELSQKGITFRPDCYLGDEWFSPEDEPAIAIPFYLAHPRLKALELRVMMEVEGGDAATCQRLLRHECGHAVEHAYGLHRRAKRKALFGPRSAEYDPDHYKPHPYSRSFVRNLPNWYAQAHPDEDFAETFAVWLDPSTDWRAQYRGWKALEKLQYVDELMKEIGPRPPAVAKAKRECEAARLKTKLGTYYKRRQRQYAADFPDFYDSDLRQLFTGPGDGAGTSAAVYMRRHRRELVDVVSRWTGERKVAIEQLVRRLTERAKQLALATARGERETAMDVASYLATLVTNYRLTGQFRRSV